MGDLMNRVAKAIEMFPTYKSFGQKNTKHKVKNIIDGETNTTLVRA